MRLHRSLSIALLGLGFALSTAPSQTHAALIAYEGFSPGGPSTNVVGTSNGSGFIGAWVDSVGTGQLNRTPDNNNMTAFPANVPFATPTGGKVQIVGQNFADNTVTRTLANPVSLDGGKFYLSFLFNDYAANTSAVDREARVFLGNASQRIHIGPNYSDRVGVAIANATAEPFTVPAGPNRADSAATFLGQTGDPLLFIVAEFVTQSVGNDTINVKAYSFTPGTGFVHTDPSHVVWDATLSFNGTGTLDQLGLYMEGLNFPEIDEIRLGQTWFDVTGVAIPEPASISLLALGSLALLRRRAHA